MSISDSGKMKFDSFDSKFRSLSIRENEASFSMYRGLEHEDLNKIESEISELWKSPETGELAKIRDVPRELARPLELLRNGILRNSVEGREEIFKAKNECNQMLVEFKLKLDGVEISRSDHGELMRWEKDYQKRRRAAGVFVELEKDLHPKVLDLIEKRNRFAKELGFESFPHMMFRIDEANFEDVRTQLTSLLEKSAESYRAILKQFSDRPEMTPGGLVSSDLAYLFENYLPNLPNEKFPKDTLIDALKNGYRSIGVELDKLPIQTVIQDIPAGGFCFTFDPGKDIRILANPRDGWMWYQILFHEFGHAVQGSFAKGDGHYLVALSDPGFFWEGIAVTFEKLALRESFIEKFVPDLSLINEFTDGVNKRILYRVRRLAADALFEYSVYLEPASYEELVERKADMVRKYFLVEPALEKPTWTHDIFHITHPIYIQNYVLAEMMARHILDSSDTLGEDPWSDKFARRIIDELLVPGGMVRWDEKIRNFTGKPLSADALVRSILG